ncbi:MAG: ATPase P [Clostridia bacterium]|nr:ATPase P [Clostridia bacterium]
MIRIEIPGREALEISHIVLDYNGTIAVDGLLVPGLEAPIEALSKQVELHVLTADTYGTVRAQCAHLPLTVHTFPRPDAGLCKEEIVKGLSGGVACFGNGFNDIPMFDAADLAVAVLLEEGMYAGLLTHADILVRSIHDGLSLFLTPDHIRADLRS